MNIGGTSSNTTYGATMTWSHTVTAQSGVLFLLFELKNTGGVYRTASNVKYNGVAMTEVANSTATNGSLYWRYYLFALNNPDVGAHDISITPSGSCDVCCVAADFYDSGTEYTGYQSATGNFVSTTTTITSARTNVDSWIVSFIVLLGVTENPSASGHTQVVTASSSPSSARTEIGYVPTATQLTTQYTWVSSSRYFLASLEIKRSSITKGLMWFF
jgi:hypothetical protein